MDRSKRVVTAYLNSAENYFHTKRVLEDQVKQPRDLYGPENARPERWDYTDVRDIVKFDLDIILDANKPSPFQINKKCSKTA